MNRELFAKAYGVFEQMQAEPSDADVIASIYDALVEADAQGYKAAAHGARAQEDAAVSGGDSAPRINPDEPWFRDARKPPQAWTPHGGWQDIPGLGRVVRLGSGINNFEPLKTAVPGEGFVLNLSPMEASLRNAEQDFSFR